MASIRPSQTHRVFVDSTVVMAAALSSRGSARDLLVAGIRGDIPVALSPLVLAETERNIRKKAPEALVYYLRLRDSLPFELVTPEKQLVEHVATLIHPKDAAIVAGAIAAHATHLVTYDRKHLLSKHVEIRKAFGLEVVTPDQVLPSPHPDL